MPIWRQHAGADYNRLLSAQIEANREAWTGEHVDINDDIVPP
jgi:hypothetical protein